jgi:hypothetical protein
MVQLYLDGRRIASWAEGEAKIAELASMGKEIELRDEAGKPLARVVPPGPLSVDDAFLSPSPSEIDRIIREESWMTLSEFATKQGWK